MKFLKYLILSSYILSPISATLLVSAEKQFDFFQQINNILCTLDVTTQQDFEHACIDQAFTITNQNSLKQLRQEGLIESDAQRPDTITCKIYATIKNHAAYLDTLIAKLNEAEQKLQTIRIEKGEFSQEFAQEYNSYINLINKLHHEMEKFK